MVPHLDAIFQQLAEAMPTESMVVAGDFNSCRLADKVWPGYGHLDFFERVEESGFVNCHWHLHKAEARTLWGRGNGHPFQDDHIFISKDLEPALRSCQVLGYEPLRGFSDHAPIEAELDLG